MGFPGQCQTAEAEVFTVEGIYFQPSLKFAESFSASAEDHRQPVVARSDFGLVLVAKGVLVEFFKLMLFELQMHGVAKARGFRAVRFGGNSKNV